MGLFGKKSGGILNVIRCDEKDYLIHKWTPDGALANTTNRENSIRWGSSLRVRDGETAVFVYKKGEVMQDIITGPFTGILKTENLPVISNIIGLAYAGQTPFQAEVYFINTASVIQVDFAVPYFDVADPRFLDVIVPVAVGGKLTFSIKDIEEFIKVNKLIDFSIDDFRKQIIANLRRHIIGVVTNIPMQANLPLVQIERNLPVINETVHNLILGELEKTFGIKVSLLDITRVTIDKESQGWLQLRRLTIDIQEKTTLTQAELNIENMKATQRINLQNLEESLAIQREEMQRAQRLQSESAYIGAHALNRQSDILQSGVEQLGSMGSINISGGGTGGASGGGGFNPAAAMMGVSLGGAVGQQMSQMMGGMTNAMQGAYQPTQAAPQGAPGSMGAAPPPVPGVMAQWFIVANNQQAGPFDMSQLQQLKAGGHLAPDTLVWREGMTSWSPAVQVAELTALFTPTATPPPIPGGNGPTPPPIP